MVKIAANELNVKKLHQVVYKALKSGKTEVDLEIGQEKNNGEWDWGAWALIDISCRRVYAFKIILKEGRNVEESKKKNLDASDTYFVHNMETWCREKRGP